ncbi:MAG: S49 family peptidase [Kordiimonadales bacterium]|nr:MAG: S49 family peptidase [Kordiimonadales bacterium]
MAQEIAKFFFSLRRRFFGDPPPRVAVVKLYGIIAAGGRFRQNLSLESVTSQIEHAFGTPGLSAVALLINSPGGSPVQSAMICKRIRDLARERDVPVLAFAEDLAASGGYMLALAADEIFANESSIVGSIGVVSSGFGFKEAIKKLGIERRLYTAGESKAMLDAFQDEDAKDVTRLKEIQHELHENFKKLVRDRRGKRLKGLRSRIFSGEVFTGAEAVKMGLIDGIGDARTVLRARFGNNVKLRMFAVKKKRLGALFGLNSTSSEFGGGDLADLPRGLLSAVEERLWWNKFGL